MLNSIYQIIINYLPALSNGLLVSVKMILITWVFGLTIGTFLGFLCFSFPKFIGMPIRSVSFVLTSTPILVFLYWLHYPAQSMLDMVIDPFYTSTACFTVINIFAVSEILRNHFSEFPKEYLTAAKVCGLSYFDTLLQIQLPLILRQVLPGILALQVSMLHLTLFASIISVDELFRVSQIINSQIYKPVEIYSAIALFYISLCLPVNLLAEYLKNRFSRNISDR